MKKNNIKLTINYIYIILIILIIIFITLYIIYLLKINIIEKFEENKVIMVISRYNETLDWIKEEPFSSYKYIVYNKGTNENFYKSDNFIMSENIDNVGRESHSYLYHIIKNYDNLADITIFLHGSLERDDKYNNSKKVLNQIYKKKKYCILCSK